MLRLKTGNYVVSAAKDGHFVPCDAQELCNARRTIVLPGGRKVAVKTSGSVADMQKAKSVEKQAGPGSIIQGRKVASAARGMTLVRVGKTARAVVPESDQAQVLVAKAAKALKHPGIDRRVVFRTEGVVSYSVNPADPTQFIRESADGSKTLGYVVRGKFQAAQPKAIAK